MSYTRVIPRDLFNEANLLKCYGRLAIALDIMGLNDIASLPNDVESFDIVQDESDGSLYIENLPLEVRKKLSSRSFESSYYRLFRPLNSRELWPLYATEIDNPSFDPIAVFDVNGNVTLEMMALIWYG